MVANPNPSDANPNANGAPARDAHTAITPLKGRRAVITGGTTGIGRAIARLLAAEGAQVFVCGRNEAHLADAIAAIREVGTGDGIACDLADKADLDRFFAEAEARMGGYDICVLNGADGSGALTDTDEDELRYQLAAHFTHYVVGAHKAARHMTAAGGLGDIVMTGSYSTHKLGPASTIYAGMKSGIQGFAEALRRELGQQGVRVTLVTPAKTGTDIMGPDTPPAEQAEQIARGETMRAEDIAVGVHYALTQPERTVVQEIVLVQRNTDA